MVAVGWRGCMWPSIGGGSQGAEALLSERSVGSLCCMCPFMACGDHVIVEGIGDGGGVVWADARVRLVVGELAVSAEVVEVGRVGVEVAGCT